MISSRDLQEIVSKLSADKAKSREEGVKLLNTWLDGERSVVFCHYLGHQTAALKPNQIPHSETWPFLVSLLVRCVSSEVSSSKRRLPKLSFAKTLRIVVQRAEDAKFSGKPLPLLPVVKTLFSHVWEILSNVPSFQTEYAVILRHLLSVRDYRFHLRSRVYCRLVLLYLEKVESSLPPEVSCSKEEVFRYILTLHSLLENPPGDFPDDARETIIKGLSTIFSLVREEGKISRKLIECVNMFLLKDGPNLGSQCLEFHEAMRHFVFHVWTTTHDRGFKDVLYSYAALQLNLSRGTINDIYLVDQILDMVCKDLDQASSSGIGLLWGDVAKDEKFGSLRGPYCKLVEIAALGFYRACVSSIKVPWTEKRVKREPPIELLKDALMKGKWLWHAAFLCLIRKYSSRMSKDIFMYWFEGISTSFERIMSDANLLHSFDGLLWTLRSLRELFNSFILLDSTRNTSSSAGFMKNKFSVGWQLIWRSLIHGLPLFSNHTALGQLSSCIVSQDLWDLKLFNETPSASALYFIACYFSQRVSQGDFRESLRIRKRILRACLSYLHWKESVLLNEDIVHLLPAAAFALSVGCSPFEHCQESFPPSYCSSDPSVTADTWTDVYGHENRYELVECSVEALARINSDLQFEVSQSSRSEGVHLPKDFSELLLKEMESYIIEAVAEKEKNKRPLSEVIFICTLLSNFIYGSRVTRKGEEVLSFVSKAGGHLLELLDWAVNEIQKNHDYLQSHTFSDAECELRTSFRSFRSFVRSPIFVEKGSNIALDAALVADVIESARRLFKALVNHFEQFSESLQGSLPQVLSASGVASEISNQLDSNTVTIVDMDLDVDEDSKDTRLLTVGGKSVSSVSLSAVEWKMGMIALISSLMTVLGSDGWDVLYELMEKECDNKVSERMLYYLCQQPHWKSLLKIELMVNSVNDMVEVHEAEKLDCSSILVALNQLICSLLSKDFLGKDGDKPFDKREFDPILEIVGQLVTKVAESGVLDWLGRAKLIDCMCNLVLLSPSIGQTMVGRLLLLLKDPDYRVRFNLAGRISILFQTWEGHEMLFEDICSNLGVVVVLPLKEKLVTAKEVLETGPQPYPRMETAILTLMHLSYHSEKIEMEAVFMLCVVSAIDPCHRELVTAALDELSTKLQYSTRLKYLEQLLPSILFSWVACRVSLVALVEIRNLFLSDSEPGYFIQYCCRWLLPALFLHEDNSNLYWVSQVTCQSLTALTREYFVPIFAVCMALRCSKKSGSDKGALVLQSSILQIASLSENDRDKLIKKHMVSIVSQILSLASCSSDPQLPFFSRETVADAIRMVVDGFLDMENHPTSVGIIDQINIFRPDRVFMFVLEMHYQIQEAVNHRHKCEKLAGLEVLMDILGHRVAVASTSNYIINLVGQLIAYDSLEDQCCRLISGLLKAFGSSYSKEVFRVLGDQLQFLVSKLVAGIIASKTTGETSSPRLTLLSCLTVDSDPLLYNYVRELEPFPEIGIFDVIRQFHEGICNAYSPREHLLDLVTRSSYLPPRLLLWSVQGLHKKWLLGEHFQRETTGKDSTEDGLWHHDREIVHAVWTLVSLCSSDDANTIRPLVSDFVCKVGIEDPHCVVFHLPGDSNYINVNRSDENMAEIGLDLDIGISDGLIVTVLKLLNKYLMDDSARTVDITSQALRGILSTEKGQRVMLSFNSYERSLLEIHSKGVDFELVQKLLLDMEKRSRGDPTDSATLKDSSMWETSNKTFETWICPLVHSLIGFSKDIILRLCQDIVLLKAEVAELLLPVVMVDLARRKDANVDLHQLISSQVQGHILTESNKLTKSIQVFLSALNELRTCYVKERSTATSEKRESTKLETVYLAHPFCRCCILQSCHCIHANLALEFCQVAGFRYLEDLYEQNAKLSSHGSKSRSSSVKVREPVSASSLRLMSSSWEKVYWLTIDYQVVAKSAVICGSYFTTMMYVEHWCEEKFNELTLGKPDFSHLEVLPDHIEVLVSALTRINEPDSLYGIIQSHKLTSQVVTYEHEGNWSNALEYYDLQVRSSSMRRDGCGTETSLVEHSLHQTFTSAPILENESTRKPFKGLVRSLQQIGCTHLLDVYCQGLTARNDQLWQDVEFSELQYEAAWRAGKWDFLLLPTGANSLSCHEPVKAKHYNEDLHRCLKAFQEGDLGEFHKKLQGSKQELLWSISCASEESTEYIFSAIVKLQILYHVGVAWNFRWPASCGTAELCSGKRKSRLDPVIPTVEQLSWLDADWSSILNQTQLHMGLLEPFIAFRRVLLQILGCDKYSAQHLLQSASTLRKGTRFSQASAALHEFKFHCTRSDEPYSLPYWHGRLEEAKLLRAQGQHEMAIGLADYISQNCHSTGDASDVHRLVGKWLAETRSSNSRTILEKHLKPALSLAEEHKITDRRSVERRSKSHFHLAHYADALFRSYEQRLSSSEWQAAMRLRKLKTFELEALIRRLKSSRKEEKEDYALKIRELQRQLSMDKEEAEKLEEDKNNFLSLALEGYKRCLVIGDKYDVRVVFRLVSLWFNLSSKQNVINNMLTTIDEVQSYKFMSLVYQIASRMGSSKDSIGPHNFQFAVVSLVKKMALDHPYHTIFQLLALANGDRIKDKQRSRNSFVVDMDKIISAKNLLEELSSYRGAIITQMKHMVEIYVKLAEMETKREDVSKKVPLPRDIRSTRQLELVPVITASFPVDRDCRYPEGSFPHFKGLGDSVVVMNGINAPKVVECLGSDGKRYRQLAKSGNDDLRQDAVMEQFFGLVNTFLQSNRDTRRRSLGVRTYKVVPFTPSAGVLEWVDGTLPLGEYLIGSARNGGAHGRYGVGDWSFAKCREQMANAVDKRRAFQEVCNNFRPVLHHFFLERFFQPADWFQKRLAYTRSVAASSMVGYIVGLGDRHSMNILIDQASAEVVHIDLGVAFEQGLMLKTPERVPFRLTRDTIDGMGITGVEGVFRRCCEETLSVMRTNKEALLTIVEVFIHDPLYKWALSPLKALQRQKETDDDLESSLEDPQGGYEGNKDAARALMRVKQKLDGYEEGEQRSVHGQVQQLIQDAIDTERLCQMFPGWGAWL